MNSFQTFAHNGVVHVNQTEATAHIMTDVLRVLAVALIGVLVIWLIYKASKKFGYVMVSIKNRRGDK